MNTLIGIGYSQNPDNLQAAEEAAYQAKRMVNQNTIQAAIVFNTMHYNPQIFLPIISQAFDQAKIIGCLTPAIILSHAIEPRGIAVLAISSTEMSFGIGAVNDINTIDPRLAGATLANNTVRDFGQHHRHNYLFFTDAQLLDNPLFHLGIQEVLGTVFPIAGFGTCADMNLKNSQQYHNMQIFKQGACGILMGGQMILGVGTGHGWKPLGKPRLIDHAEGHTIHTIDGKKAFNLYEEFLGEEVTSLQSLPMSQISLLYPLGIYTDESHYILRTPLRILPDGSIVCQGEVPTGGQVHLMISNTESCHQAARDAAFQVKDMLLNRTPRFILVFQSLSRNRLLNRNAFNEIKIIKDVLGYNIPLIGMLTFGEISPFQTTDNRVKTYLHNASITILTIG